ncbi:hypothetical protein ACET9R_03470 [Aeromonas veronii]
MTDLFSKLEALLDEQPDTPHTYKPPTAVQYDALECRIYRMGPQIDGTQAWPPERMLEWLQQQIPHNRGVAIAMMHRVYRLGTNGALYTISSHSRHQKAPEQMTKNPPSDVRTQAERSGLSRAAQPIAPTLTKAADQINNCYKSAKHQVISGHRTNFAHILKK